MKPARYALTFGKDIYDLEQKMFMMNFMLIWFAIYQVIKILGTSQNWQNGKTKSFCI